MRGHPLLYEANARVLLARLSVKHQRPLTLSTVPEEEWRALARRGFDFLWLMGAWKRSPAARGRALALPELRRAYDQALPGWTDDDVAGSPYAVLDYSLDPSLGKEGELAELKGRLNRLGLGLMLDFVSNHVASDHAWTASHPERFVRADEAAAREKPEWFFTTGGGIFLAHGRDPNFPPWTDTAQANFFSADLRQALEGELLRAAQYCDGVRCDMAMLALNRVFEGVWGAYVKDARPKEEFWPSAIRRARDRRPGFVFLAEAYWGLEWDLQELGFDFTYDKTLYDRLRHSNAPDLRGHLRAVDIYQRRSARFIENHDEERAAAAFGPEKSMAAAAIMATVPGLRFFHDGQLEGRRVRLPIQLIREPAEAPDARLAAFYDRLLAAVGDPAFHGGEWMPLEVRSWGGEDGSSANMLAWSWRQARGLKLVVVNYSEAPARGLVSVQLPFTPAERVRFLDLLSGRDFSRGTAELREGGLGVELGPWEARILDEA